MEQVYDGTSHLLPERMMEALAMMAPSRSLLSQAEKRMDQELVLTSNFTRRTSHIMAPELSILVKDFEQSIGDPTFFVY